MSVQVSTAMALVLVLRNAVLVLVLLVNVLDVLVFVLTLPVLLTSRLHMNLNAGLILAITSPFIGRFGCSCQHF